MNKTITSTMNKIYAIWSAGQPDESLKKLITHYIQSAINQNIAYQEYFKGFTPDSIEIITNDGKLHENETSNLKSSVKEDFNSATAIIILAELNWGKLSEFKGIELIRKLRMEDIKTPIIVCSHLAEQKLLDLHHDIIAFSGHYFIQLPDVKTSCEAPILPLDEIQLTDVKFHYCDLVGIVSDLYHEMKQKIFDRRGLEQDESGSKAIVQYYFNKILQLVEGHNLLEKTIQNWLKDIASKNGTELIKSVDTLLNATGASLTAYLDEKQITKEYIPLKRAWKILWLEDQSGVVMPIINKLVKVGIDRHNIIVAQTYDEAVQTLKNDKSNQIHIIISDYRINDFNYGYRTKQGYQFLQWCARQEHYHHLFALSGLNHNFINTTFKQFHVKVDVHSKNILQYPNLLDEFVEDVISKGDEIEELIHDLPETKNWKNLQPFYVYFRSRHDYEDILQRKVYNRAERIINQVRSIAKANRSKDLKEAINNIDQLERLASNFHEPVTIDPSALIHHDNLIVEKSKNGDIFKFIPKDHPYEEQRFNFFINKLTARIVYWWLRFQEEIESNTIMILLKEGKFYNIQDYKQVFKIEKTDAQMKNALRQLKNKLAIADEDYPHKILVEEQEFIRQRIGSLDNTENKIDQITWLFERFIETGWVEALEKIPGLSEWKEGQHIHIKSYREIEFVCKTILESTQNVRVVQQFLDDFKDNFIELAGRDSYTAKYVYDLNQLYKVLISTFLTDKF
jgi:hypothetical protein